MRTGDLAARMGVTQQAASKAVAELAALGYVDRTADPADGRVRRVGLSARGRAAVATTRAVRADIARELTAALGADRVEAARRAALDALEWAGGAEAVRAPGGCRRRGDRAACAGRTDRGRCGWATGRPRRWETMAPAAMRRPAAAACGARPEECLRSPRVSALGVRVSSGVDGSDPVRRRCTRGRRGGERRADEPRGTGGTTTGRGRSRYRRKRSGAARGGHGPSDGRRHGGHAGGLATAARGPRGRSTRAVPGLPQRHRLGRAVAVQPAPDRCGGAAAARPEADAGDRHGVTSGAAVAWAACASSSVPGRPGSCSAPSRTSVLGDPRRWHPVAGFGTVAGALERRVYADRRAAGAGYVALLVGGAVALGAVAEAVARRPVGRTLVTAAATWVVLGGASLAREGAALAGELERGDLGAARARLPALCGRDPAALDASGLARAAVESVAENTSDAVVAPLLWGARGRACRGCSATGPSTRSTRWSGTGRRGTCGSGGRPRGSTTWRTSCRRGSPRCSSRRAHRRRRLVAGGRDGRGGGTRRRTRARTRARWRPPRRGRSASRWAGGRCTGTGPRSARAWATGPRPARST